MGTPTRHDANLDEALQFIDSGKCTVRERMAFLKGLRHGQRIASGDLNGNCLVIETFAYQTTIPNIDRITHEPYETYERICVWAEHNGRAQLVLQLRFTY